MSRVRGRNTRPEITIGRELWARGLRCRLKRKMYGKPDINIVGAKIVVFVDGCFWHGCPEHGSLPKTNPEFWADKLEKNKKRGKRVNRTRKADGWKVLRFWEYQIKSDLKTCANIIELEVLNAKVI